MLVTSTVDSAALRRCIEAIRTSDKFDLTKHRPQTVKHPTCIDALENRLNTSIEFWKHHFWHVTTNCSKGIIGHGETIEEACNDLLVKLHLERA